MKKCKSKQSILLLLCSLIMLLATPLTAGAAASDQDTTSAVLQIPVSLESVTADDQSALKCLPDSPVELIPGGCAFGVKIYTKGVWLVGFSEVVGENGKPCCPARDAGFLNGDIIISINGEAVSSVNELTSKIEASGGEMLRFQISRQNRILSIPLKPVLSGTDHIWRAGFWLRDNTAGIGTVTYIDPKTGFFGGLGHGICDAECGSLIPLSSGTVMDVNISGVVPGKVGTPGELKGYFLSSKLGSLLSNTNGGVFGILTDIPEQCGEALPVAREADVEEGTALIRCTLGEDGMQEFQIRIDAIHMGKDNLKNFEITVIDPELLKITGGIVQGMSGSPIIQNGKLIGAVTHVFVNDPAKGYGIFIGNMLNEANR